ncbi:MAG: trypsin-like serine protease [Gammaproteobacteria bacterium]|nr:trypsin-like serine protease [Gammaproteobacteria bacterium]
MTSVTGKIQHFSLVGLVMLLVIVLAAESQAIIIRHDKSVRDYRARESRFPAVFYLERQDIGKICVATLIDPQWAITAAHCGSVTSLSETLRAGSGFAVSVSGQERLIDLMVAHPNYTPDTPEEVDLALIRFSEPLVTPRPVRLNGRQQEQGKVVSLLGWGFWGMGTTGRQSSDGTLRMAQNRIETAGRRLTIQFGDPRQSDHHVLELEGMPSLGDSGGPALLREEEGWVLAGIAIGEVMDENFDEETQGKYGSVAVYERISRHLDWIASTIRNNKH